MANYHIHINERIAVGKSIAALLKSIPEVVSFETPLKQSKTINNELYNSNSEQRKNAMERLLKRQDTMSVSHWTDEEFDNFKYEYLKEKYQ